MRVPVTASVTGTRHLLRLILRRDRIRLPVWMVGLGGVIALSALAVPPIYDTPEKVAGYAAAVGASPVSYLMSGRQAGIDTIGGIVANEISQVAQLGICLMVTFLVVRHTRAEEETARAELVRSTVMGRHAATLASLLYGVFAAVLIGAITTGSMLAAGLGGVGSLTYGIGLTLLGLCYVAVGLVAAQLSTSARGALGMAGAAIAIGYLLRGVGAMQDNALVWASPFGWAQRMDAFGAERWWPALLLLALTAVLLGVTALLTAHRDFGGGLLQTRPGRSGASGFLGTPLGLALRLQRGLLVGWAIGLSALGLLYGAVIPTIPDLVASNPDIAQAIGASADGEEVLIDAFLRYIFLFMAVICTGFAVASVLRLRTEEESGRAEMVLATRVPRTSWAGSIVIVAGLGALLLTLFMGSGLAVGYGLGMGEWDRFDSQLAAQLSYLPGVLVVAAVAFAVAGLLPRWSLLGWAGVAFVFLQVMLGETLRLPAWLDALSPFWHLPGLPVETFDLLPAVAEIVLAAALVLLGLWGFRRRDLAAG
jgi:ABC-2 type transport system permease protein